MLGRRRFREQLSLGLSRLIPEKFQATRLPIESSDSDELLHARSDELDFDEAIALHLEHMRHRLIVMEHFPDLASLDLDYLSRFPKHVGNLYTRPTNTQ